MTLSACRSWHAKPFVPAGSLDNTARVWDLRKRGALYCITGHTKLVSHVQFEPTSGHYLLTASYDQTCKIWSAQSWRMARCLAGHAGAATRALQFWAGQNPENRPPKTKCN